jgi:hypothetical protein
MPTWKDREPEDIDLAEALQEMAPQSAIRFNPTGLEVKIVAANGREYYRSTRCYDPLWRAVMWALLVPLGASMVWARAHPILPEFGGIALMALLFGGAGLVVFMNLDSGLNSRAAQVVKRAKSATPKEEIILEMVSLYWALRFTRPMFSVVMNPLVAWDNEDNNLNIQSLLPLKKAMIWAAENADLDWRDRSYIQEHLKNVEDALGNVNRVWTRGIYIPLFLHFAATVWGATFTLWSLAVPFLVRL